MNHVRVPRVQHRLWLADQLTPGDAGYLGSTFLRLRGPLDTGALERALTTIVTRHEVLRTSLDTREGELAGVLRPAAGFRLGTRSISEDALGAALAAEAATPLDISAGLPLRALLLRLAPDDHVLCLTVHHLAFDRGSVGVLYRELTELYAGRDLPPVPRQFRDLAAADDAAYDAGELASIVAERREALADLSPFELAPDHPRPQIRGGEGALRHGFALSDETARGLAELARAQGASLYMVLLAGVHALLYRYSGRGDVTTGASSSTRREPVIGPFFNMLVLPGDVSANPAFTELVGRVRDAALDAYDSRALAFDSLVTELRVERDPSRTPLFQILVDLTAPVTLPDLDGIEVDEILTPGGGSKYDLTIEFRREGDGVAYSVEWDTALYESTTVMRLMAHLRAVLDAVAADPSLRVDEVPVLADAEVIGLRAHAEPGRVELPERCLHELFSDQAARTPAAVAVQDSADTLTYAELERRVDAIARALAARGVGADTPVGVMLERSADLVAVVLGVLKAGGAYLPIEPDTPPARVRRLLDLAGAELCVSADDVAELLLGDGPDPDPVRPGHLCAVYFTSGSTGEPKGVACTHRGWVGQMANLQERYQLAPGEAVLLKTPLTFDDVAREIFWPLMAGARVVVLPPGLHRDAQALLRAAIEHEVVWLQFVPSMLVMFLDEIGTDAREGLHALRHVVSDGDRLRPETVAAFYDRLGCRPRLNNHWGTTEVSIDSTHHVCTPADADGGEAVCLGRPMENHEVYVLDHTLQPVPHGAVGELCIGGVGLARGYVGDPGKTARAFVPHPWRAGERVYRTGDTGRLRPDGSLQYRGRRDHQVKVRGVRIELGEVEAALRAYPGVTDAVVATWEPLPGDKRLAAYVSFDGPAPAVSEVRAFLGERLAPQAVPSAIVALPKLPRMPSGKVDRRSLPEPDPDTLSDEPFVPPRTDTEVAIAEVWSAVLGVPRLGANDDFFAMGGHSLLVTRAVNRMREAFALDIPLRLVFEHSTVRAAAARLEELIFAEIEAMSDDEAARLMVAET
ncbi:non-ribosomal peptide synthetase [Nonomuraea endophytica]|uniref:Amino acid adenylation domain-containing protein n=1 Tax=Nonomuraea endophytica TaxID=714136 RepID=A0A7W8EI05_9ACTN|nr:non-ribosomal peptide synthetase [Nonomuraea endophytica]MBB5080139.1 amino acid adenylation domain-containing protein [Nonomuraea endophytica]